MFRVYWVALAVFAAGATYLWAFEDRRHTLTTAVASASWAMLALTGNTLDVKKSNGSTVETVDVPVGESVQLFLAGLALLSFIAFVLVQIGGYPPEQTETDIPDANGDGLGFRDRS